jgi:hypothetical protein
VVPSWMMVAPFLNLMVSVMFAHPLQLRIAMLKYH